MSWAEVKKVNSDFTTPLDVRQALTNISLMGNMAFSSSDVDMMKKIVASDAFYANEIALNIVAPQFFDYLFNLDSNVGNTVNNCFHLGVDSAKSCLTWSDCLNNQDLTDALSEKHNFFSLLRFGKEFQADVFGNSGAIIQNTRQGIFKAMRDKTADADALSDAIRDTAAWGVAIANAEQFVERSSHVYEVSDAGIVLAVCVGAGGTGETGKYVSNSLIGGVGGECGKYIQILHPVKSGDIIDATITATGTTSEALGVVFGAGEGNSNHNQAGKVILLSGDGGKAGNTSYNSALGGAGGTGGYGGGDGSAGTSGSTTAGKGGTGANVLTIVDGGAGSGGGASTAGGGGGGGGYGGGGGAGGSGNKATGAAGGAGGSGCIIIFH